jgi:hypothetical protein
LAAYVYHFGDLYPSGQDAARDIEAKLRRYAPSAEIHFERVTVTREQVEKWDLPSRRTTETDSKKWTGTSVELDAIPAHQLGLSSESALIGTSIRSSSRCFVLPSKRSARPLKS